MINELINYDEAMERLGGDKEFLIELLSDLVDMVDENLPDLEAAISENDYDKVQQISHSLKGASSNLSATDHVATFAFLENKAREKDLSGTEEKVPVIGVANKKLREFLNTI